MNLLYGSQGGRAQHPPFFVILEGLPNTLHFLPLWGGAQHPTICPQWNGIQRSAGHGECVDTLVGSG